MAYNFGFIVESFYESIVNEDFEVIEYIILMPSDHPSKLSHGLQSGMGGPPEPFIEILFSRGGISVIPKSSKGLLQ